MRSVLRVQKGRPDAVELAALVTVLHTRARPHDPAPRMVPASRPAVARWRNPEITPASDGPRTWRR